MAKGAVAHHFAPHQQSRAQLSYIQQCFVSPLFAA